MKKPYGSKKKIATAAALPAATSRSSMHTELREMIAAAAEKYSRVEEFFPGNCDGVDLNALDFTEYMQNPNARHTVNRVRREVGSLFSDRKGMRLDVSDDLVETMLLARRIEWFGRWLDTKVTAYQLLQSYSDLEEFEDAADVYRDLCVTIGNTTVRGVQLTHDRILFVFYGCYWDATLATEPSLEEDPDFAEYADYQAAETMLLDLFVEFGPRRHVA